MSDHLLLKELARYRIGTWADIIYRNALLYPDREAFLDGEKRVTYGGFNARVNRLVNALQSLGVRKGDMLGILCWNCLEVAEVYGAAMKGGFIASPYNPRLQSAELEYLVNYSGASVLFFGPEMADTVGTLRQRLPGVKHYITIEGTGPDAAEYNELLGNAPESEPEIIPEEDAPLYIIYTSGTTGVPRGALYTHRHAFEDSRTLVINMSIQPEDRHVQISPLFHIAGNSVFRAFLYSGACNAMVKSFDPAATLRTIQEEKITHMMMVPTHLIAMLSLPEVRDYDISSMKMMWYGASPMPVEVLKRGMETFGRIFAQGYGQTESGPAISHLSKQDHDVLNLPAESQKKLASTGRPDVGVQVRIVDEENSDVPTGEVGEITVRSRHIMGGYWQKPEDTKQTIIDGWLHTGDMGYCDPEGYIYIVDRKKDVIISGGENVYPREVEEILYRHPAVHEATVIGIPDDYWVEKVHAVVVPRKDGELSEKELIAFCKARLAGYKCPKSVEFAESLPKTSTGKIMKRELREKYK